MCHVELELVVVVVRHGMICVALSVCFTEHMRTGFLCALNVCISALASAETFLGGLGQNFKLLAQGQTRMPKKQNCYRFNCFNIF